MEKREAQDPNDFKGVYDDQDRLFFQLSSNWDKTKLESQKIITHLHEFKLIQSILYSLITLGIIVFFILMLINIYFIIIIIDIVIVIFYIFYLIYLKKNFRKTLKISKRHYKFIINLKNKDKELTNLQIIFYSIIIFITIFFLISSIIDLDPLNLIIALGVSLICIYVDKEFEEINTPNS